MRLPRMTTRRLLIAVAIVAVYLGVAVGQRRRQLLREEAAEAERSEFEFRRLARQSSLTAELYESPPRTEAELERKDDELHLLQMFAPPFTACVFTRTSIEELRGLDDGDRRSRVASLRRVSAEYTRRAEGFARSRRDRWRASSFPWEAMPPVRPLPTPESRPDLIRAWHRSPDVIVDLNGHGTKPLEHLLRPRRPAPRGMTSARARPSRRSP